ncbi:MAG: methyltransferase type 11, partial [Candidatus Eremiobacteraeota bacterium]|nr:methyltransferase type 11 [Candidatus Eremiobacteraeota bacterium]
VQTPNYYFPIEPHFLFPGFQFLPVSTRARLLHSFDLGWSQRESDLESAREVVDSVKLLKRRELADHFPDAKIYDERYLGLTKSFIAYGGF